VNATAIDYAATLRQRVFHHHLDEKVEKAYPDGGWEAYRATIERCGNPPDQIANFERARVILQPKQLEFAAWARRLDTAVAIDGEERGAPELGFGGAKGPGKSFGIFTQVAADDCQRFPGLKCLYLRKTGKRTLEQIEDLVLAVLPHTPHKYTRGRVDFPNGSAILIGHFRNESEAMNYAGIEYDVIALEEATTLSERAYKALRQSARTSKDWRPRVYDSTNPLGVGHRWYKKRFIDHERKFKDVTERTRKFVFATVDDNHFVNPDYRGNLEDLSGAEKRAYLDGDWDVSAGAYFDEWRHEHHVIPSFSPPRHWKVWASMDYGFNHWNVIYLHTEHDGITRTFEELAHRKRYPKEIVPDLRAKLAAHGRTLHDLDKFIAGSDVFNKTGATEKSVAEQYAELGIKITPAEMAAGSRIGGARHLAKLLGKPQRDNPNEVIAPRWLITENCVRLIECLPSLEADPNNPEDVLKVNADEKGEGGDDPYDGARYGLFTTELEPIKVRTERYA
jgi:phage terminase large subunit